MSIENVIDKIRTETGVPYIDVICYKEHKEIFRYTSGDCATGKELLYMYSCSKPITVTAALRLVEQGLVSIDDPVCKYLPEMKNAFYIDEGGERVTVGKKMTLRHLFTMTAGFTYNFGTPPIQQLIEDSDGKAVLRDFIPKLVETPLSFKPGTKFQYSLCHDIIAAVVEVVSGKRFSEYVNEAIFAPLEMYNSRFDNGEVDVADIYMASEQGVYRIDEEKILLPTKSYESGGAGLCSTVEDYVLFADALACGGISKNDYKVLSKEMIRELTTEQVKGISVNNSFSCIQGDDYGYGLGVRVRQIPTEWGLGVGEYGWDGAAGSYVMIDPERKVSIFVGMHVRSWPIVFRGKHIEIVKAIYEGLFG